MKTQKFVLSSLKNLGNVFADTFAREKMIQLENRLLFSLFWKGYSARALTLASSRTRKEIPNRLRLAYNFTQYLYRLYKANGIVYVIKYLKYAQLALSRAIARTPLRSMSEIEPEYIFPRLTRQGLPKFLGSRDRRSIMGRSASVIRFWMTLFSLYRVLLGPCALKLSTITDPFKGDELGIKGLESYFRIYSGSWLKRFSPLTTKKGILNLKNFSLIQTSSPSSTISWHGIMLDLGWLQSYHPDVLGRMLQYAELSGNTLFFEWISRLGGLFQSSRWVNLSDSSPEELMKAKFTPKNEECEGNIGQLAFKKEPAGKLRVFAMVDWWTQQLLQPLHDFLFSILRKLPNDGTFDQEASFKRCQEKAAKSGCSFGYDLSAATDRLPLSLQVAILTSLLEPYVVKRSDLVAKAWGLILTQRPYAYHYRGSDSPVSGSVKYAVGQPMGALSSWAMLAITHHLIVQFCAISTGKAVGGVWFSNYEVLGDDIQIFDRDVAAMYLEVMRGLGVDISLAKSVVSEDGDVVEYAKRISIPHHDVSAVSWRMVLSQDNFSGRIAIALHMLRRSTKVRVQKIVHLATSPMGGLVKPYYSTSVLGLFTSLAGKKGLSLESMLLFLVNKEGKLLPEAKRISPTRHEGIKIPYQFVCKKIRDFFQKGKVSIWFEDHWSREDATESIEKRLKQVMNEEIGDLARKLSDSSFVRRSMLKVATLVVPGNEDNIDVFREVQQFVDLIIFQACQSKLQKYIKLMISMYSQKRIGLYTPKDLDAMDLLELSDAKRDLAGVLAHIEIHKAVPLRKEKIHNSLKIIAILIKSLRMGSEKIVNPYLGDPRFWLKSSLLFEKGDGEFLDWLKSK